MKKALFIVLMVWLAAMLLGCADTNVMESVELTAKENLLVSALTDQTSVFEYRLDGETYRWMTTWSQRYEYGELKETINLHSACEVNKGGNIVLSIAKEVKDVSPAMFNIFILQDGVISSQFNALPDIGYINENGRTVQSVITAGIPESGNVALMIIHTAPNGFSPVLESFFTDYENNLEGIADYEIAYVVGCTFSDEMP